MKRLLLYGATLAGLAVAASPAFALASLTGDINFDGSDSYDANTVTFVNPAGVTSETGNLTAFGTCQGVSACITAQNITYNPFVGPLNSFLAGTNNGLNFALDIESVFNIQFVPGNDLDFDANAVMHLTGFADTPGELFFSTQGPNGPVEVSFSATAVPTPEPASLAVLGVGLLGLGFVAKRKRRA